MIGRERIASAPFWKVEDIDAELLLCYAEQDPSECLGPDFDAKRKSIKTAIGQEHFFDPAHPQKRAIVPKFHLSKHAINHYFAWSEWLRG
jgi:hypothetical protein